MLAWFGVRAGNMGFMPIPVLKPARTSNSFLKHWLLAQAVHADNIRAAEVRSAEATELPVWKRPPVSVANGLCHPLGTGSRVSASYDTVCSLVGFVSGLGGCFQKTGSRVAARDDTVYSLVGLVSGLLFTISPFHLST